MKTLDRIRYHPKFWGSIALLIGLAVGAGLFDTFSGLLGNTQPAVLQISNLADLAQPPIIQVPAGDLPRNYTYNQYGSVINNPNCLPNTRIYVYACVIYVWWYQWLNSTAHRANDWEYVIVYWNTFHPYNPELVAIAVRFHFFARVIRENWSLNGTRPIITFSPTYHIPTVQTGIIHSILTPSNMATIFSYKPIFDPYAPPANGTNAYAPGAGPPDPLALVTSAETIQNGLIYGLIGGTAAGLGSWAIIALTLHPNRKKYVDIIIAD